MRLTEQQTDTIKRLVKRTFGQPADVYLFGSRADDHARGGDIDLYIDAKDHQAPLSSKLHLASLLQMELGEQRFDIVLAKDPDRAIEVEARATGVRL